MKYFFGIAYITIFLGVASTALAQTANTSAPLLRATETVALLFDIIVAIVLTLAIIIFFWGVARYMMATSDTEKQAARSVIIYGVIGIFIIFSIWAIVGFIQESLGVDGSNNLVSDPLDDLPLLPDL